MILIFSKSQDPATNSVVPWLVHHGCEVVRINDDEPDPAFAVELDETDVRFRADGKWYSSADIAAVWYRKGGFWFPDTGPGIDVPGELALSVKLQGRVKSEMATARAYFHYFLRHKGVRTLGNPFISHPNKLIILHKARELGLKIPDFGVVNALRPAHIADPSAYVTKAMSDGLYLWDFEGAQRGYFSYTEDLEEVLAEAPADAEFPISFVQRKIAKSFEIRSFYLDGEFLSAAIYSQGDPQTAVDYRKYNYQKPSRNVPMTLPEDVAAKLDRLCREIELNTGSIDMIVDQSGEFVFLEINPTGQYTNVSNVCNFDIDRLIAEWLIGGDDHE